jgi:lactate permease
MTLLPVILAASPFVLFLILLLWRKTPLIWVSFITVILVLSLAVFFWKVYPLYIYGSIIKGFFVAIDILFIIFGAIFFLEIMKETKIVENIGYHLESISKDLRIQVIFLAWFFENFLEGTAGFGTPSTVVAPLLIGLGISPINAVIIALLGNSSSVVFGAAGTPIKVGFGSLAGPGVPFFAALINLVGILVPAFMLWFLTKGKANGKKEFIEALPFALWAGIAFIIPSIFTVFLGQEFPSIFGSVIGLVLVLLTTKLGIFIPKREKEMSDEVHPASLTLQKVIFPYILLITLLVVGKFALGSNGIVIPNIIKHTIAFFNPGFAFIIAGITVVILYKINFKFFTSSLKISLKRSVEPFLVIAFMSILSQIMVASVHNTSLLPSMVDSLAVNVKNMLLPFWAPVVGAFGSFLTGSATVSNLMFGNFLAATARDLGLNIDKILALAVVGGAAGNMIALGDIITAEAVVGLKNKERSVLAGVIIPCLIYVVLVGVVGFWFVKNV